jgi:hypothetical protein
MGQQTLTERVTRLLEGRFPGVVVALDPTGPPDRVAGWIVWAGFENRDQVDRQRLLRQVLSELPAEDRLYLGPILTLTPDEASDEEAA